MNTDTETPSARVSRVMRGWTGDRLQDCAPGLDQADTPAGNLLPTCLLETWDGAFHFIGIDPSYMENEFTKENLLVFLRRHIRQHRALALALMSPVWMAHISIPDAASDGRSDEERYREARDKLPARLGDTPGAIEQIMIWSVTQFSREITLAPIIRHAESTPTIGDWITMPAEGVKSDRFSARLQQSLIAVA